MQTAMEHIDGLLGGLRGKSLESLRGLPELQEAQAQLADGFHTIAVWKDELEDGSIRIVAQAYRPGFFVGRMTAKGFVVSDIHAPRELCDEELWDLS